MNSDTPALPQPETGLPTLPPQPPDVGVGPSARGVRRSLRSAELLGGATAVDIEHLGQTYRLQATRTGKLILTK